MEGSDDPIALPLPGRSAPARRADPPIRTSWVVAAMVVHAGVGFVLGRFPSIAPGHALLAALAALWIAWSDRSLVRTACAVAYIAGSEALWRITEANLVWELGKYSISAAMLVALLRHGRFRPYWPPLAYLLVLLPGAFLTFTYVEAIRARQLVSFDLSGPVSLAVGVLFFIRVRLTPREMARVLIAYVVPTVSVAVLILLGLADAELSFGRSSMAAASGGFGPNQISAGLGLATLAAFLVLAGRGAPPLLRGIMAGLLLAFAAQSALTFSRCGLYYFAGGALVASAVMLRNPRMAAQLGGSAAILAAIVYFFVYPWLDDFTGGALSNRFRSTDLTNRDRIMAMDLRIFAENPLFGIGVGRGKEVREAMDYRAASHTEYTRLLAEHGVFGVLAILLLLWMGFIHFVRGRGVQGRAIAGAMVAYTLLYMTGNGMRQVLPGFTFGLAAAMLLPAAALRPGAVTNVTSLLPPEPSPADPDAGPVPGQV